MDDFWSSLLVTPLFSFVVIGVISVVLFWIFWKRHNLSSTAKCNGLSAVPPYSRSSSQVLNRENSHSGTEGKSSQVKQRRKRSSVLNTFSHELAGFGRRATVFSKTRLESVKDALLTTPRKQFMKLSNILVPNNAPAKRQISHPPSRMFEVDYSDDPAQARTMENMLRAVRAFCWGVEKSVFQELCKSIEMLTFDKGDMLFEQGSMDDSVYVVQSGQIDVVVVEENKDCVIKSVKEGENIFSMMAVIERLAGVPSTHIGVAARCVAPDTQVARLPLSAFCDACASNADLSFATVQTIMIKLSRVVFNALHTCLGLSGELVRDFRSSTVNIQSLARSLSLTFSDGRPRVARHRHLKQRLSGLDYLDRQETLGPNVISEAVITSLGEKQIIEAVLQDLLTILDLSDASFLEGALKVESIPAGSQLHGQDDRACNMYIVVHGVIQAFQEIAGEDQDELFYTAQPGSLLGQLSILSGEPSTYSLRAKTDAVVVSISRDTITRVFRERPQSAVPLANVMVSEFPPFVRHLDHSLGWKQIESGRSLYKQNDSSDCAYVILHGRIRTVQRKSEEIREVISEHGRDDVIGLVEVLTSSRRLYTSLAVRDSEVCSISGGLIEWLKRTHPKIVTRLIHVIGNSFADVRMRAGPTQVEQPLPMPKNRPPLRNLSTIAIVPASKDVPLSSFSLELQHALNAIGPSLRLTGMLVMNQLGVTAFDAINEYHLQTWLSQQEETYRMILYQCDSTCTPWTQWCLRQADAVLEVALATSDPYASSKNEFDLDRVAVRAQKELVLLYRHDYEGAPKKTSDWLAARGWCHGHHHIRCPKRLLATASPNRIISTYRRLFDSEPNPFSDFSRLARYLTGTSIGLALGGGGARGIAHIGILRSMMEAGIPVDMVAGTSIGSYMAALWAKEMNLGKMAERATTMSQRMLFKGSLLYDMTYPYAGMFTGRYFNSIIRDSICEDTTGDGDKDHDIQIEDLWLPYACITTDVTSSKMRIHTTGSLWRYIRASMTLAGYMPPLCDPNDGHLLVDGGYTNNLPADVLRAMGCSVVFTVDVGAVDDMELTNYGDEVSGWALLGKRFWPWGKPVRVPNIADIQSRLAYVACCRQLETVKQQSYCIYVRPPIDKFKTLAFNLFDDIYKVGYNYGRKFFSIVNIRRFFFDLYNQRTLTAKRATTAAGTVLPQQPKNYTELAEMVCRIEPLLNGTIEETEEDSTQDDTASLPDLNDGRLANNGHNTHLSMSALDEDTAPGGENNGSRRNSLRPQQFVEDDDDFDLEDDFVFDDLNRPVATLDLLQERSLSDTELPSSTFFGINKTKFPLEAESLPVAKNNLTTHLSLSG